MFKNLFLGITNRFYNKRNLLQKIFIVEIVIFVTVLICSYWYIKLKFLN